MKTTFQYLAFQVLVPKSKTAIAKAIAVLLAGALGLEPRAYGFGGLS